MDPSQFDQVRSPPRDHASPSRRRYSSPNHLFSSPSAQSAPSPSSYGDRFIPSRLSSNLEDAFDVMDHIDTRYASTTLPTSSSVRENQEVMNQYIRAEILSSESSQFTSPRRSSGASGNNVLKYKSPKRPASAGGASSIDDSTSSILTSNGNLSSPAAVSHSRIRNGNGNPASKKITRKISKTPYKILDAPNLQDDYYLNLVDWSSTNTIAVALGPAVYLWSAHTAKTMKLCDVSSSHHSETVTSVTWAPRGLEVAVGTLSGKIYIWDVTKGVCTREITSHANRVGTLAWSSSLLASGSRDRSIMLHDVRLRGCSNPSESKSTPRGDTSGVIVSTDQINEPITQSSPAAATAAALASSLSSSTFCTSNGFSPSRLGSFASAIPKRAQDVVRGIMDEAAVSTGPVDSTESSFMSPPRPRAAASLNSVGGLGNSSLTSPLRSSVLGSPLVPQTAQPPNPSGPAVFQLQGHQQEVCGLKWSGDERMLASGGNDNLLCIWNPGLGGQNSSSANSYANSASRRSTEPLCRFTDHVAAVKAVAWSPHQHGLVASGGGTADRNIRFWNCLNGSALHRIDTGSQVCNLVWSKTANEIVSTHGYSLNQVIVWKYPSMQKLATLAGHTMRVLYLAMSPDGQNIVTGAGDECLRFWNVFAPPTTGQHSSLLASSTLIPSGKEIR